MKKTTKASLIIFIVTFIVGYVMASFIPEEILSYSTLNGSILSFLGSSVAKMVGMRTIIAVAIALTVTLLIRIIEPEEKKETKKVTKKTTAKKGN